MNRQLLQALLTKDIFLVQGKNDWSAADILYSQVFFALNNIQKGLHR
jgi:hypothetical protein